MGSFDRVIRLVVAATVAVLVATGAVGGAWAVVLGVLAVVFLLTSSVGTCPLYKPFGISTVGGR